MEFTVQAAATAIDVTQSQIEFASNAEQGGDDSAKTKREKDANARLSLSENLGANGGGIGVRWNPRRTGFYLQPEYFGSFHANPVLGEDPFGRYLGIDPADTTTRQAIADDPLLVADKFMNSIDDNPWRFRVGVQGDILKGRRFGPTIDFSFDPVQVVVGAKRSGAIFEQALGRSGDLTDEAWSEYGTYLEPFVGDVSQEVDGIEAAARGTGTALATALGAGAGLAGSARLGVGMHARPFKHFEFKRFELGATVGVTGLGVYRGLRDYSQSGDAVRAAADMMDLEARMTWLY